MRKSHKFPMAGYTHKTCVAITFGRSFKQHPTGVATCLTINNICTRHRFSSVCRWHRLFLINWKARVIVTCRLPGRAAPRNLPWHTFRFFFFRLAFVPADKPPYRKLHFFSSRENHRTSWAFRHGCLASHLVFRRNMMYEINSAAQQWIIRR